TAAGIDDPPRAGRGNRLPQLPPQLNSLLALGGGGEALGQLAIGGPAPGDGTGCRRFRRWCRWSTGRSLCRPRLRRWLACRQRCGPGRQPQTLPGTDGVRWIDVVPAGNGTKIEAVAPG